MKKLIVAMVSAVMVLVGGASFAPAASAQGGEDCQTIVEIAAGNPDFSTLVTAVTAAGLVDTLNGDGPFTVFAPTNEAFAALPAGTLDALLADPTGALTDVLKLHVIAGRVDSAVAIAAAGTNVETLGGPVAVELNGSDLTVGGAPVVATDIEACNGIVHVLSAVITAPAAVDQPTTTTTVPATPSTTAPTAKAPAATGGTSGSQPVPTAVNTGDSGLATSSGTNGMAVALVIGFAILGLGAATVSLARQRDIS